MATLNETTLSHIGGQLRYFPSDAKLRDYLGAICDFYDSIGFERTADSGQYDPDTVTVPGATDELYEIREFSGSLAGTKPVVVKFHWNYDGSAVGLSLTIGTGSNGSGAITGAWVTKSVVYTSTTTPGSGSLQLAGVAGEFVVFHEERGSSNSRLFVVSRTVDSEGAPNGKGVHFYCRGAGGPTLLTYSYSATSTISSYNVGVSTFGDTETIGLLTASPSPAEAILILRSWGQVAGEGPSANTGIVYGFQGEHATGGSLDMPNIGSDNHVYKATAFTNYGASGALRPFFRWE